MVLKDSVLIWNGVFFGPGTGTESPRKPKPMRAGLWAWRAANAPQAYARMRLWQRGLEGGPGALQGPFNSLAFVCVGLRDSGC